MYSGILRQVKPVMRSGHGLVKRTCALNRTLKKNDQKPNRLCTERKAHENRQTISCIGICLFAAARLLQLNRMRKNGPPPKSGFEMTIPEDLQSAKGF